MSYDFTSLKAKFSEVEEWLRKEYSQLSTGRISPQMLDSVMVSSYGTLQPIKAVASLSIEDARTLRISPWDRDSIKNIENAIIDSGLPLSVATDDAGLRVSVPQLTDETRQQLLKVLKKKLEDARVSVRQERQSAEKDIDSKEKGGEFAEDDKFRLKDELQKLVDAANTSLEGIYKKKEADVLSV